MKVERNSKRCNIGYVTLHATTCSQTVTVTMAADCNIRVTEGIVTETCNRAVKIIYRSLTNDIVVKANSTSKVTLSETALV